jgi:hypothetical protein
MSPAACAGSPPGPRSESRGAARLLCAVSCGSGLAVAERMEHQTSAAFVGVQVGRVLGLEAADLDAVFYGALPKGFGACGAVLTPFFAGQDLAPRLGGLCGVTGRVPALASTAGLRERFRPAPVRVRVGKGIAGPGPRRPASRVVTLLTQPGYRHNRGHRPGPGQLAPIGREGQMAA